MLIDLKQNQDYLSLEKHADVLKRLAHQGELLDIPWFEISWQREENTCKIVDFTEILSVVNTY